MSLSGGKLAGGNPSGERVENDYYATDPKAVKMLLDKYQFKGTDFLEPCVGAGHIANTVKDILGNQINYTGIDIEDRGYQGVIIKDFIESIIPNKYDCIISNPPYSLAKEFVEKSISLLKSNGQIAMFLKIQFLEGSKRKEFFEKYPPKYIYVFRNRMATWKEGKQVDDNGKKWSTTMCHAWFIWEKENGKMSETEPIIRWL